MRFYCTSTGPIGGLNCEVLLYFQLVSQVVSIVRFHCTYTIAISEQVMYIMTR